MKKVSASLWLVVVLVLGFVLTGCGTLNRSISYEELSGSDVAFVERSHRGSFVLNINSGLRPFATDRTANKVYMLPPAYYIRSLGEWSGEFGYRKVYGIWPVFINSKESLYNSIGYSYGRVSDKKLCPIFGYSTTENEETGINMSFITAVPIPLIGVNLYNQFKVRKGENLIASRYEFLHLPIIGPCFGTRGGPHTGRPRFLWIPCGKMNL